MTGKRRSSAANALLVGAGVLLSRLAGFVRERIFAHYLGNSDAADAFKAALRIPNALQNLFGEGALSASFIPVYARLLAEGREEEAKKTARAVGTLLALLVVLVVAVGVLATPLLIDLIAPGFAGEKREWTIVLVRVLFPGIGLLVLSAWCLGILNSHRRFFLPYAAPVLWNGAMIAALVVAGLKVAPYALVEWTAWGAVAGSLLQLAVQLPAVRGLAGPLRADWAFRTPHVKTVVGNFLPSVASRGVTQVSSYVDQVIASFLPAGAVSALAYAQTLYLLPVSLFGMSVSSAELPELSSGVGADALRERLDTALRRVAFLVVPSVVAFAALGDRVTALVFQTGAFSRDDVAWLWAVLAGSAVGLLAMTLGRLYASAFWALHDTRTPLKFAVLRVALSAGLGALLAFEGPGLLGVAPRLGLAGLTLGSGLAGWLEMLLLRRALNARVGRTGLPFAFSLRVWGASLGAAAAGWGMKLAFGGLGPVILGVLVCGAFAAAYGALALAFRVPEASALVETIQRRLGIAR